MYDYNNLVICKELGKRAYTYKGTLSEGWKLKDTNTNKLYDSHDEYIEEQEQLKKKAKFKENMAKGKKKAAIKKEAVLAE